MAVKRIVANIYAEDPAAAASFYRDFLGLDSVMDHGWIVTYAAKGTAHPELSVARQGGSDTPLPALSIEVDDIAAAYRQATLMRLEIVYDLVDEPWGVRRFYVRDPFGNVINILAHVT